MAKAPKDQMARNVRYLQGIKQFISEIPRNARAAGTEAVAQVLVDKYLAPYPPYRFYSRADAYPEAHTLNPEAWQYMGPDGEMKAHKPMPGYFSLKQWRFVMSLRSKYDFGFPHRTGELQRSWKVVNAGIRTMITNTDPGAPFVVGKRQARQPQGAGWIDMDTIIEEATPEIVDTMREVIMKDYPYRTTPPHAWSGRG